MSKLKKSLSLFSGTALFLNIVIGAGLLILPGIVYKQVGVTATLSWLITAFISLPLLLVFIVLGRDYPDAGGISHYAKRAFGGLGQRYAVLLFLGAVIFGLPSIALTGGYYFSAIIPGSPHAYAIVLILLSVGLHLISGNHISKAISLIASCVTFVLVILLVIAAIGAWQTNTIPLIIFPKDTSLATIFSPFMVIFFAFTGWEIGSHASEEFNDPRKDFPIAMLLSFIIATAFYLSIAIVVQKAGLKVNFNTPFIELTQNVLGGFSSYVVSTVAILIIFANLFGAVWGVSRLIYSLGRDGLLPSQVGYVDKSGIPVYACILTLIALVTVVLFDLIGFLGIEKMLALAGQNFLILYGLASASLFILSYKRRFKLLAIISVTLISIVLLLGHMGVFYPLTLLLFAWMLNRIQNPNI